jgi:hypothetical protein
MMTKLVKRVFKITVLALVAGIVTIAGIVLFPQKLFANKMSYKNFSVYSNDKIGDNLKTVLDDALHLIERSELYDPIYKYLKIPVRRIPFIGK